MQEDNGKEDKKHLAYSPNYDAIIKHFGTIDSSVFGLILNKSNLKDGCCKYSEVEIGNSIHCSWSTVSDSIKRLLGNKLIEKVEHYEKTSKLNKTKWYKPVNNLNEVLLELSNKEPEPIKSNINRTKNQEINKNKFFNKTDDAKNILYKDA